MLYQLFVLLKKQDTGFLFMDIRHCFAFRDSIRAGLNYSEESGEDMMFLRFSTYSTASGLSHAFNNTRKTAERRKTAWR